MERATEFIVKICTSNGPEKQSSFFRTERELITTHKKQPPASLQTQPILPRYVPLGELHSQYWGNADGICTSELFLMCQAVLENPHDLCTCVVWSFCVCVCVSFEWNQMAALIQFVCRNHGESCSS